MALRQMPSWCPSEAGPMGQISLTMRFGNNQVITQRAPWVPRCPKGVHSPATQCWTGKAPLLTGLLFLPKAVEPANNRGTGQEQVQPAGTQWDKTVPEQADPWHSVHRVYLGEIFATAIIVSVSDHSNCSIKKPSLSSCEKARSKHSLSNQDSKIQEPLPSLLKPLDHLCSLGLTWST